MTIQNQLAVAKELAKLWAIILPTVPPPGVGTFASWLGAYDESSISYALSRTANKARKMQAEGTPMQTEDAARYASSVMKNEQFGIRRFDNRTSTNHVARTTSAKEAHTV